MHERMTPYVAQNYAPVPECGCWIWLGALTMQGYGKLGSHGRNMIPAHRLFYAFHKGQIPDGMIVCHKCDTPACVNPEHLFLGTHMDNCVDKIRKGRARCKAHQGQPSLAPQRRRIGRRWSKLRPEDIPPIMADKRPNAHIARDYGVSRECIRDIKNGLQWKWKTAQASMTTNQREAGDERR